MPPPEDQGPSKAAISDRDQAATTRLEAPWTWRSLNLSAMPVNSRSLPQLTFEVPGGGQTSADFVVVDRVTRRSLSQRPGAGWSKDRASGTDWRVVDDEKETDVDGRRRG